MIRKCVRKSVIVTSFLIIDIASIVNAASFDCKEAKTSVEKMICADEKLSKLDDELAKVYARALITAQERDAVKREQREWFRNSRNTCKTADCVASSYTNRIAVLNKDISRVAGPDMEIHGTWQEFKTSIGGPYYLIIKPGEAKLTLCKSSKFIFQRKEMDEYYYTAQKPNCYFGSRRPVNLLVLLQDENGDIGVKYYSGSHQNDILGEEHFFKIDE